MCHSVCTSKCTFRAEREQHEEKNSGGQKGREGRFEERFRRQKSMYFYLYSLSLEEERVKSLILCIPRACDRSAVRGKRGGGEGIRSRFLRRSRSDLTRSLLD